MDSENMKREHEAEITPSPVSPSQTEVVNDQSKQSQFMKILLLVLVSVLLLGGGMYVGSKFLSNSRNYVPIASPAEATPSPIVDETANWKTFNDETLSFSIENPVGWFLKQGNKALTRMKGESAIRIANSPEILKKRFLSNGEAELAIDKYTKSELGLENISESEFYDVNNKVWVKRKNESGGGGIPTKTYSIVTMGSYKALLENVVWQCISGASTECIPTIRNSYFLIDQTDPSLMWEISTEVLNDDPNKETLENQINQILSTFQFTDQKNYLNIDTTDWKTYTNDQLGLNLKYDAFYSVTQKFVVPQPGEPTFIVSPVFNFNLEGIELCETYKETICLIPGKNWWKEKDIQSETLAGKLAQGFFLLISRENSSTVLHVIQTTINPKVEIALSVDGVGGEETFQKILSTVSFSN